VFSGVKIDPNRVALSLAFAFVALALVLDVAIRNDPISVDFHTYLAAAQVGLHDGWSHVYDQGMVALQQKELVPQQVAQPFISPPTVALVTAPLAGLPFGVAYTVWAFAIFAAFALALGLQFARRARERLGAAPV